MIAPIVTRPALTGAQCFETPVFLGDDVGRGRGAVRSSVNRSISASFSAIWFLRMTISASLAATARRRMLRLRLDPVLEYVAGLALCRHGHSGRFNASRIAVSASLGDRCDLGSRPPFAVIAFRDDLEGQRLDRIDRRRRRLCGLGAGLGEAGGTRARWRARITFTVLRTLTLPARTLACSC